MPYSTLSVIYPKAPVDSNMISILPAGDAEQAVNLGTR